MFGFQTKIVHKVKEIGTTCQTRHKLLGCYQGVILIAQVVHSGWENVSWQYYMTIMHTKMTIFMINALSWSQFMLKWTNLEPSIFSIFLHSSPFDNTELSLLSIPILPGPDLYSEPWKIMWTNGGPCFRLSNVQSWWLLFVLNIKLY